MNEAPPPNFQVHPPARGGASAPFLLMLLALACIGLGVVLSWGLHQRRERVRLTQRNHLVETAFTDALGRRQDLAAFLIDPRTRLIRLPGRHEQSGKSLSIAWRDDARSGFLIAQDLLPAPEGFRYAVWAVSGEQTRSAGRFDADPGTTIANLSAPELGRAAAGFKVSLESRSGPAPGGNVVFESN